MRYRILLVPILILGMVSSTSAGITIFGKKPKIVPETRVPELLSIVKNDGDENKRYEAAEELRQYDPTQFPLIVPTLIEVVMNDKKASVRSEAVQSLAKLRPLAKQIVEQQVVPALEYARDKDASLRVRTQARSSLLGIHWYTTWHTDPGKLKQDKPAPPTTKEPPLAPPALPPQPLGQVTTNKPKQEPVLSPPPAPIIVTPPTPVVGTPLPKGPDLPPQ
jgi:hypothetical protein